MFLTYSSTKAPVSHRKIKVIFPPQFSSQHRQKKSPCSFTSLVSVFLSFLSLPHFRYTLCRKISLVLVNTSWSSQCRPFQLSSSSILSIRKRFRQLFSPLSYCFRSQTVGNHRNVFVSLCFTQPVF